MYPRAHCTMKTAWASEVILASDLRSTSQWLWSWITYQDLSLPEASSSGNDNYMAVYKGGSSRNSSRHTGGSVSLLLLTENLLSAGAVLHSASILWCLKCRLLRLPRMRKQRSRRPARLPIKPSRMSLAWVLEIASSSGSQTGLWGAQDVPKTFFWSLWGPPFPDYVPGWGWTFFRHAYQNNLSQQTNVRRGDEDAAVSV